MVIGKRKWTLITKEEEQLLPIAKFSLRAKHEQ